MKGSAVLGVLLFVVAYAGFGLLPQPFGSIVVVVLFGAFLVAGATVTWMRTRLGFAAAGMLLAFVSIVFIGFESRDEFGGLFESRRSIGTLALLLGLPGLLLLIESKLHPVKWRRWKEQMRDASLLDIVLLRHIPDLVSESSHPRKEERA